MNARSLKARGERGDAGGSAALIGIEGLSLGHVRLAGMVLLTASGESRGGLFPVLEPGGRNAYLLSVRRSLRCSAYRESRL